jgi:hypothetical protein
MRIVRTLVRADVIEDDANAETLCLLDDGFAERDPHSSLLGWDEAVP